MQEWFRKFARRISDYTGSSWGFIVAIAVVAGWIAAGPWFHFSDTWQLVINTGTTIVTFLMVFLIQNTQNRDAMVMQLKLDELLRAVQEARTGLVALEDLSDETLAQLKRQFAEISEGSEVELSEIVAPQANHAEPTADQPRITQRTAASKATRGGPKIEAGPGPPDVPSTTVPAG